MSKDQATFTNKEGKKVQRIRCTKYSRVSGFITPVSNYNIGKKSEFYSRKFYNEQTSLNSQFVAEYGCGCEINANLDIVKSQNIVKETVECK